MIFKILLSFLPWILFGVFAGPRPMQLESAVIIALFACSLSFNELRKGFILAWGTLFFFVFSLVSVVFLKSYWVMIHMNILPDLMLTIMGWGSLLIGIPFTIQYAKQAVPKERWQTPLFNRTAKIMTSVWAIIFTFGLLMSILSIYFKTSYNWVFNGLSDITIILGIVFTVWFPTWYTKKRREP